MKDVAARAQAVTAELKEANKQLEIGESGAEVIDRVPAGGVLVDGLGVGDVGNIVLRAEQFNRTMQ